MKLSFSGLEAEAWRKNLIQSGDKLEVRIQGLAPLNNTVK